MQIPKEYLEEKNYEGTRLIEINDKKVAQLKAELKKLQESINPFLDEIQNDLTPLFDKHQEKIKPLQEQLNKLKEEIAPTQKKYEDLVSKIEPFEQKAQLIKNKVQPIVLKLVTGQLGEFEKANQIIEKDNKLFVEVVDEIEEKVKAIRAMKAKNDSSK